MSYTFDAIVFPRKGEIDLGSFELPECGPDEVVVKTRYSLISTGTELRVLDGHYGAESHFPFIPGYSIIGTVVETGAGVTDIAVGDWVSGRNPMPVPGIEHYWGAQASMHRYETSGYGCVLKLPAGTDPFDCLIAEVGAISWRGVKHAGFSAGETALVVGQGLIGALSAKFLLMHGLKTVVVDVHPLRLERSRKMGVNAAIDARAADANEQIREALGGAADILVEASGQPAPTQNALQFLRPRATGAATPIPRIVFQANYVKEVPVNLAALTPSQSVSLFFPSDREPEDRQDVLKFIAEGKLSAREFVDDIYPFRDAPRAYAGLREAPEKHFSAAFDWE